MILDKNGCYLGTIKLFIHWIKYSEQVSININMEILWQIIHVGLSMNYFLQLKNHNTIIKMICTYKNH